MNWEHLRQQIDDMTAEMQAKLDKGDQRGAIEMQDKMEELEAQRADELGAASGDDEDK